jgi:hypothetical protein
MTPEKKEAVRGYLNTLGPRLRKKYGERRHYTPQQVYATTQDAGLSVDYVCFAYMLYCSPADFSALHAVAGEVCDAVAMRAAVADTFFSGNPAFDAVALADGLWGGVVSVAETGAEVTVSVVQTGAEVVVNLASAGAEMVVSGAGAVAEGAGSVFGWLADVDWGGLFNFDV